LSAFAAQELADEQRPSRQDIKQYLQLVQVALGRLGRYLPPDIDQETLQGKAILALLDAAQQVPMDSAGFAAYARIRIWRSLVECLGESRCFMVETQAALRRLAQAAEKALRSGLAGTEEELAHLLVEPIGRLRQALEQAAALMVTAPEMVLAVSRSEGDVERRLAQAICKLPQREQLIVAMYYFEELTFAEIGRVLEMSEQQVQWAFGRAAVLLKIFLSPGERL